MKNNRMDFFLEKLRGVRNGIYIYRNAKLQYLIRRYTKCFIPFYELLICLFVYVLCITGKFFFK